MTVREPDSRPAGTPLFGVPVLKRTAPGYRTMATKLLGQPLLPREATAALCRRAIVAGKPFALAKLGPSMLSVLYFLAKDRWLASGEADRIIHWHGHNRSGLFPEDAGAWQSFGHAAARQQVRLTLPLCNSTCRRSRWERCATLRRGA